MNLLLHWMDGYLIHLYRATGFPLADYFIGTFMLALASVVVGDATVRVLRRVNHAHLSGLDKELSVLHDGSMESKRAGDEIEYQRLNRLANDAFGRVFFNMFTLSAASLWFVFIALAWMQIRFMNIEFQLPVSVPVMGRSVGYVFTFLLMYILARILFANLKRLGSKMPVNGA